jgi:hypothetical protein
MFCKRLAKAWIRATTLGWLLTTVIQPSSAVPIAEAFANEDLQPNEGQQFSVGNMFEQYPVVTWVSGCTVRITGASNGSLWLIQWDMFLKLDQFDVDNAAGGGYATMDAMGRYERKAHNTGDMCGQHDLGSGNHIAGLNIGISGQPSSGGASYSDHWTATRGFAVVVGP